MEIKRDKYLNDLIIRKHNGLIKVITGLRRCGKSYLLFTLFKNHLLESGVDETHIIGMELDLYQNRKYRDPDVLMEYIELLLQDDQYYYILLDEVQMLKDFEEVLNSLLHIKNVDIYVTGSNSKFLSTDIITEFRGRGDEVRLHPLSFKEYMQVYEGDVYHGWADYLVYGGMPLILTMKTEEQKQKYLQSLFEETYVKDIVERNKVEKVSELNDIINVIASSVGSLSNPSKIENTFKSVLQVNISDNTIKTYIKYLKESFLVNEAQRYDVKGRKYIGSPLKYYFEDVGLRNARLGFRQVEETHLMENIIFNELLYRGYNVDAGIVPIRKKDSNGKTVRIQLEIDFVANKGSQRYYVQSAFSIPDEAKAEEEKASLEKTGDSFKKIIVVKDVVNVTRDDTGITTISLYDFLLNEDSLNL